jgi:hypothetical protein
MTDSSSGAGTDSNTTPCQFCGDEYKARGVAAHERACDENPENQSEPTQAQSDEATSESDDTETPLEKQALERDGCQCRRCGATGTPVDYDPDTLDVDLDWDGDLDVDPNVELTVEPLVPGDSVEALQELVTLCPDIVDGLHYLTKRTEVFFLIMRYQNDK